MSVKVLFVVFTGDLVVKADPEQTAIEGETAVLQCNVTSYPAPRVIWSLLEGGMAVELTRQEITDSDFGVYRIPNVTQSDAGDYRCSGRYQFDQEDVDITLVVLSK